MTEIAELDSVDKFLLNAPLYQIFQVPDDRKAIAQIFGRRGEYRFDGHCPFCEKETVFILEPARIPNGDPWNNIRTYDDYDDLKIHCVRNSTHIIKVFFKLDNMKIQKIGQFPSLADIANNEVKIYRKLINEIDKSEFYKAIGLAAHGVGVGSFVYLRRVFERLISARFNQFKDQENWELQEFQKKNMVDRIVFLKDHLPPFLVNNARIYSILSKGIHELDEEVCLKAFDFLKSSIITILEEDEKKLVELSRQNELTRAIAAFNN